jgi:hypothetical protein
MRAQCAIEIHGAGSIVTVPELPNSWNFHPEPGHFGMPGNARKLDCDPVLLLKSVTGESCRAQRRTRGVAQRIVIRAGWRRIRDAYLWRRLWG